MGIECNETVLCVLSESNRVDSREAEWESEKYGVRDITEGLGQRERERKKEWFTYILFIMMVL